MTSFTLADADTMRQFAESHVDEGWDPVEVGNEDQIGNIVMEARTKGIITCPEGAEVDFDYSADGDGGGFQFLVRLTRDVAGSRPRIITLASPFGEMRNIVSFQVTGPAAVAEILAMAVVEANAVVADLAAYNAAEPHVLVEPTLAGEVTAVLSQALTDADAEIRRVHEDDDYSEEDIEYAVEWRDRVEAASKAFEAAATYLARRSAAESQG